MSMNATEWISMPLPSSSDEQDSFYPNFIGFTVDSHMCSTSEEDLIVQNTLPPQFQRHSEDQSDSNVVEESDENDQMQGTMIPDDLDYSSDDTIIYNNHKEHPRFVKSDYVKDNHLKGQLDRIQQLCTIDKPAKVVENWVKKYTDYNYILLQEGFLHEENKDVVNLALDISDSLISSGIKLERDAKAIQLYMNSVPETGYSDLDKPLNNCDKKRKRCLQFKCDECPRTFQNKSQLNDHYTRHFGFVFVCKKCHKISATRKALRLHYNTHANNVWKCSKCGKVFNRKSSLRNHQLTHEPKKVCPKKGCTKSFRSRNGFEDHVLYGHSSKLGFKCNVCSRRFKSNTARSSHFYKNHRNDVNQVPKGNVEPSSDDEFHPMVE